MRPLAPRPASRHRCRRSPGCRARRARGSTLEDLGQRVGLEREPEPERQPGPGQRRLQAPRVLREPGAVVDEQRRPMRAGERLGVLAGDAQPAVDAMSRPGRTHQGARATVVTRGPGSREDVAESATTPVKRGRVGATAPRRYPASSGRGLPRPRRRSSRAGDARPPRSRRSRPRRPRVAGRRRRDSR